MKVHIRHAGRWLLVILLCGLIAAAPVFAQDEEATEEPAAAAESAEGDAAAAESAEDAEEVEAEAAEGEDAEEEAPQGLEILMLLLGIGAVLGVGLATMGKESSTEEAA